MAVTDYMVRGIIRKMAGPSEPDNGLGGLLVDVDSQLVSGQSERLDFLGTAPAMRQWVGARQARQLREFLHSIQLEKWETTVQIAKDLIDGDKTGAISQIVGEMMKRRRQWRAARAAALINSGDAATCFDGQFFFDTDHSYGDSGTIDNDITFEAAAGDSIPTADEAASAIMKGIAKMQGYLDDQGEPINEDISSIAVITPTGDIGAAHQQAVSSDRLDTGSGTRDNPLRGFNISLRHIASPRITVASSLGMVLVNTSPGAAPFAMVENQQSELITSKAAGSDFEHDHDAWEYGIKKTGAATYARFTDALLLTYTT